MLKTLKKNSLKIRSYNLHNNKLPIVVSIPHSGVYLSKAMRDHLLDKVVFANVDWYLPKLYSFLKRLGFTTIINHVSRYVIDPNRCKAANPGGNSYQNNLVYTQTTFGKDLYVSPPSQEDVQSRIKLFYDPYHDLIQRALQEKLQHFDKVYLIDLHSFGRDDIKADIVLGNNHRPSCEALTNSIKELFENAGLTVAVNQTFTGGFITKHYPQIIENCEALQIELNYQTYIDKRAFGNEEFPQINAKTFNTASRKLKGCFRNLKEQLIDSKTNLR